MNASADADYGTLVPLVATHCNMWFFLSYNGAVGLPVHPEFINETDKYKPFNMSLTFSRLIAALAAREYIVTSVVSDSHQSNIVSAAGLNDFPVPFLICTCW